MIKIGCEIFVYEEDKILLGKRRNCYGEGYWGLPGGHVEKEKHLLNVQKENLWKRLVFRRKDFA